MNRNRKRDGRVRKRRGTSSLEAVQSKPTPRGASCSSAPLPHCFVVERTAITRLDADCAREELLAAKLPHEADVGVEPQQAGLRGTGWYIRKDST